MSAADIAEKEKALIIARLKSSDPSRKLSVMTEEGMKTYTIKQLVKSIEADDELGNSYVKDQMEFMRRVANGDVYKLLADIESM